MLIYIVSFAGLMSAVVLAVVYLADRYEREPIELIQNVFLLGLVGQLALLMAATTVAGPLRWSGPWWLITVISAALVLPFHLSRLREMDERFDGIVYTVVFLAGAICVIHLNNLSQVTTASPFRDALADSATPGLRDLLIIASSPSFAGELGNGLVVVLVGVLIGATVGVMQHRVAPPGRIAAASAAVGLATIGADVVTGGAWSVRCLLAALAVTAAVVIKRRSVFRDRPQAAERDVLVMAVKTLLMILGAALLATALLQAVSPRVDLPGDPGCQATTAGRETPS